MQENYSAFCSASDSNNQNLRDRKLDLTFRNRYKHVTSPSHLSLAESESLPYWFGATFAAVFVLIYRLTEFPLPALTNRFKLRYQKATDCFTNSVLVHVTAKTTQKY